MNLAAYSLKRPGVVLLLTAGIIGWGIGSYMTISRREDPKIKISYAAVLTIYPGASASEVEEKVSKPIEDAVLTIDAVKMVKSFSRPNVSFFMVQVEYDSDFEQQWDLVRARIAAIRDRLPKTIIGPKVIDDFGDVVGMMIAVHGGTYELREDTAERLKKQLTALDTVGKVEILGKRKEEIALEIDPQVLVHHHVLPLKLRRLLETQNTGMPSGQLDTPHRSYRLDAPARYGALRELRRQVFDISRETGEPITLGQVFDIKRRPRSPQMVEYRTNGEDAVLVTVTMKTGKNIVEMGDEVRQVLKSFEKELPEDIKVTLVHDQPVHVERSLGLFEENLQQSMFLVFIALLLLLGFRSAFLVSIGLPLAIIASIAMMPVLHIDLERASIAAFIVALGMLVDNSIIVIDHIHVLLDRGLDLKTACIKGAQDLLIPIFGGTIASILAFFPLVLLPDEMGAYIRSLPWVITLSLGASFFISVTLTPLMAYFFFRFGKRYKKNMEAQSGSGSDSGEDDGTVPGSNPSKQDEPGLLRRSYVAFMRASLRGWPVVFLLSVLVFGVTVWAMRYHVKVTFFPHAQREQFYLTVWTPEGSSMENTERVSRTIESRLLEDRRVATTLSVVGMGLPRFWMAMFPELNAQNLTQILVNCHNTAEAEALMAEIPDKFSDLTDARILVKPLALGIPVDSPVAIELQGDNLSELQKLSEQLQALMRSLPGVYNVRDDMGTPAAAVKVKLDDRLASRVGLMRLDVVTTLLSSTNGLPLTTWSAGDTPIPVSLYLKGVKNPTDLLSLQIPSTYTGAYIPFSYIAHLEPEWDRGKIIRHDASRTVTVYADIASWTTTKNVVEQIMSLIPKKMNIPPKYKVKIGGEEKERRKSFGHLTNIFLIILFMLFLILVIQLGDIRRALILMGTIPLALVGALVGFMITGISMSYTAFIGIIALAGVVIKNAVVWVDFVETHVSEGMGFKEAIVEAGIARFRPILLTAATTIGGLIPLAFKGGMWAPLAIVLIFGLAFATILTLVVIPVFYYLFAPRPSHKEESHA